MRQVRSLRCSLPGGRHRENADGEAATMANITLKIDGQAVSVPSGTTVMDAAWELGIEIPALDGLRAGREEQGRGSVRWV